MSSSVTIDLSRLPEITNERFYPYYFSQKRILVFVGGAGSGKSHFCGTHLLIKTAWHGRRTVLLVRKTLRSVRRSSFQLICDKIHQFGWQKFYDIKQSDMVIDAPLFRSRFIAAGLDDVEKIKSIENITDIWLEEGSETVENDFDQLNLRMRGAAPNLRGVHVPRQLIVSMNPVNITHYIKLRFCDNPESYRHSAMFSTYHDNRFNGDDYGTEIEALKDVNPLYYDIYGKGLWGNLQGLIYTHFKIVDDLPPLAECDDVFYGLDFGFNHRTALHQTRMKDGNAYEKEVIYKQGLTNDDLVALVDSQWENLPTRRLKNAPIYCDSAEPGAIETLQRHGYWAIPADKSQGSVESGIRFCMSIPTFVDAASSNLIKEYNNYTWSTDKDGRLRDIPVKFMDDLMDAKRYGQWTHAKKGNSVAIRPILQNIKPRR